MKKKINNASHNFIQSLILTITISIIITILGILFSKTILQKITDNQETLILSMDYIKIIFGGSVIIFLLFNFNSCLSAQGDTKSYRNVIIFSFILNLLLNPILISGNIYNFNLFNGFGIKGLAYSTIFSQFIGILYLWFKIKKTIIYKNIKKFYFFLDFEQIIKILSQGIPASIGMMMISLGSFILLVFVGKFGVDAISGYTAALRYEQLFILPILGLNTAVLSMVGQNYGAKNYRRVIEIYNKALVIGCLILLSLSIIIFFSSEYAIKIFSNNHDVIYYGSKYLKISAFILPVYPIFFISNALFQGLKKSIIVMYVSLLRFVFLPLICISLTMQFYEFKYEVIFLVLMLINWIVCLIYYFYTNNKLHKLILLSR